MKQELNQILNMNCLVIKGFLQTCKGVDAEKDENSIESYNHWLKHSIKLVGNLEEPLFD